MRRTTFTIILLFNTFIECYQFALKPQHTTLLIHSSRQQSSYQINLSMQYGNPISSVKSKITTPKLSSSETNNAAYLADCRNIGTNSFGGLFQPVSNLFTKILSSIDYLASSNNSNLAFTSTDNRQNLYLKQQYDNKSQRLKSTSTLSPYSSPSLTYRNSSNNISWQNESSTYYDFNNTNINGNVTVRAIMPEKRNFLKLQNKVFLTKSFNVSLSSSSLSSSSSSLSSLSTQPAATTTTATFASKVKTVSLGNLRVIQFNMLADGLSGLRKDLGAFSRIQKNDIDWHSTRKHAILYELLQYDPDVITLQECDHYYDWFLPCLTEYGYDGLFAPKPASACLEVSENSDGCAIFVKRNKLRIVSTETITYTLSRADVGEREPGPFTLQDDRKVRAQNQVAVIAVCELLVPQPSQLQPENNMTSLPESQPMLKSETEKEAEQRGGLSRVPPILIATTHLKAAKSAKGERFRTKEISQLLSTIDRITHFLVNEDAPLHREPLVILTGDLNARPCPSAKPKSYPAMAYKHLKSHSLALRSVLNDDVVDADEVFASNDTMNFSSSNNMGNNNSTVGGSIMKPSLSSSSCQKVDARTVILSKLDIDTIKIAQKVVSKSSNGTGTATTTGTSDINSSNSVDSGLLTTLGSMSDDSTSNIMQDEKSINSFKDTTNTAINTSIDSKSIITSGSTNSRDISTANSASNSNSDSNSNIYSSTRMSAEVKADIQRRLQLSSWMDKLVQGLLDFDADLFRSRKGSIFSERSYSRGTINTAAGRLSGSSVLGSNNNNNNNKQSSKIGSGDDVNTSAGGVINDRYIISTDCKKYIDNSASSSSKNINNSNKIQDIIRKSKEVVISSQSTRNGNSNSNSLNTAIIAVNESDNNFTDTNSSKSVQTINNNNNNNMKAKFKSDANWLSKVAVVSREYDGVTGQRNLKLNYQQLFSQFRRAVKTKKEEKIIASTTLVDSSSKLKEDCIDNVENNKKEVEQQSKNSFMSQIARDEEKSQQQQQQQQTSNSKSDYKDDNIDANDDNKRNDNINKNNNFIPMINNNNNINRRFNYYLFNSINNNNNNNNNNDNNNQQPFQESSTTTNQQSSFILPPRPRVPIRRIMADSTTDDQAIWTTWKIRMKRGKEEESRMCIDYILYSSPSWPLIKLKQLQPLQQSSTQSQQQGFEELMRIKVPLLSFTQEEVEEEVDESNNKNNINNNNSTATTATASFKEALNRHKKLISSLQSLASLSTYSSSSSSSVINQPPPPVIVGETRNCMNMSKRMPRYRPIGFRATAVLDLLSPESVGDTLLPSAKYPSDHSSIAADLEIIEAIEWKDDD